MLVPGAIYGAITVSRSRAAMARVVGRQLVGEARNAADRLATMLRSEQERIHSLAAQDVMREIRIGDFDKRISSLARVGEERLPGLSRSARASTRSDRVVASSDPRVDRQDRGRPARKGRRDDDRGPARTASARAADPPLHACLSPIPRRPSRSSVGWSALLDWERETEVIARVREQPRVGRARRRRADRSTRAGVVIGGAAPTGRASGGAATRSISGCSKRDDPASASRIDPRRECSSARARLPDDLPPWTHRGGAAPRRGVRAGRPHGDAARRGARGDARSPRSRSRSSRRAGSPDRSPSSPPRPRRSAAAADRRRRSGSRSRDEIGTLAPRSTAWRWISRRAERELVDAAKFAFVGELAAGVAHEVRTPLGVLRSSAQLLERSLDAKDDEARELLADAPRRGRSDRARRVRAARARPAARASTGAVPPRRRSSSVPPTSSRPRRVRSDVC